ncbi:MAG: glycerophosphoryl diester phosphodiesterase GlpQ [Rhodobacteraceae bacterium HLUCCA12]|nr:MAG: glycerophosphoryl diester phosphodiesterase GlpQ [Rhodobacteraceae bacterium HLUCCA12]
MARRFAFLDHPLSKAIAHRGGSLEVEENTLPAFAHAVGLGYSHVELDVHATRDGVVVIHHDPTLERMTGDPRAIGDLAWSDLRGIRTHEGAEIPRLESLLEEHPGLFVNIEAKSDAVIDPLARVLQRMGAVGRVGVGSFKPRRTARLRAALGAGLCWSPAHRQVLGLMLRGWRLPLPVGNFPVVQVPVRYKGVGVVSPRFVRAARRAGVAVQVWTVNDAIEMEQLLDMGVQGIMTDRPSTLRKVLQARGEWRGDNDA